MERRGEDLEFFKVAPEVQEELDWSMESDVLWEAAETVGSPSPDSKPPSLTSSLPQCTNSMPSVLPPSLVITVVQH